MSDSHDPLQQRVMDAIERYELLDGVTSILVGISGGQDSLALLHCLEALDEVDLRLGAIHVHHGMRGAEADEDAAVVRSFCEGLGAPCEIAHCDVPAEIVESGTNAEQAGRAARYREYKRAMRERGFDCVATGHTGTDRAETLLLNLFRGAGLDGLASIPPRHGRIIRPLILATRDETAAYCQRHRLAIRTDRSNLDPDYARRNMIRLRLMPIIEESFAGAERALMRACEAVEEEIAWTEPLLRARLDEVSVEGGCGRVALDTKALAREPSGLLHRLLRVALGSVRGDLEGVSREHIERMAELARREHAGAVIELPGDLRARRDYDTLVIEPDEAQEPLPEESADLPVPGEAHLALRGVTVQAEPMEAPADFAGKVPFTVYVDASVARDGLVLRSHRLGERFVPLGMTGSRKLQDFFIDNKVPRLERDRIPVVTQRDGPILWVVGHRLAEPARAEAGADVVRLTAHFSGRGAAEEDT